MSECLAPPRLVAQAPTRDRVPLPPPQGLAPRDKAWPPGALPLGGEEDAPGGLAPRVTAVGFVGGPRHVGPGAPKAPSCLPVRLLFPKQGLFLWAALDPALSCGSFGSIQFCSVPLPSRPAVTREVAAPTQQVAAGAESLPWEPCPGAAGAGGPQRRGESREQRDRLSCSEGASSLGRKGSHVESRKEGAPVAGCGRGLWPSTEPLLPQLQCRPWWLY